ncbi:MAG TPA: tRNA pseudouridine(38-40) synthase TruA [Clostridiales bacterium]|nr:tRNA pseudouridine(38-40) synthase TruA [Clostridiales bacterium]
MRIVLNIEYDGTNYAGWQCQENAATIQEEIEKAIFAVTKERVRIHGAGRTDAGVHALSQVAHFDTGSFIPPEKFAFALNDALPDDISVQSSFAAPEGFHARYSASGKHYRYVIRNARQRSALFSGRSMPVHPPLDTEKMQAGAAYLVGKHDFSSFCAAHTNVRDMVRTVYSIDVARWGVYIAIDIKGNGFLYNMVRIIAGTLILVGQGKLKPQDVRWILQERDRGAAGPTAKARGLFLMGVEYDKGYTSCE